MTGVIVVVRAPRMIMMTTMNSDNEQPCGFPHPLLAKVMNCLSKFDDLSTSHHVSKSLLFARLKLLLSFTAVKSSLSYYHFVYDLK